MKSFHYNYNLLTYYLLINENVNLVNNSSIEIKNWRNSYVCLTKRVFTQMSNEITVQLNLFPKFRIFNSKIIEKKINGINDEGYFNDFNPFWRRFSISMILNCGIKQEKYSFMDKITSDFRLSIQLRSIVWNEYGQFVGTNVIININEIRLRLKTMSMNVIISIVLK